MMNRTMAGPEPLGRANRFQQVFPGLFNRVRNTFSLCQKRGNGRRQCATRSMGRTRLDPAAFKHPFARRRLQHIRDDIL